MKLYRKIDNNGLFVEDVLLDTIPYLTETVTETITNEDGTTQEVTYARVVTQTIPEEVTEEVFDEATGEYTTVTSTVSKEVGVLDSSYIEVECPQGLYHPKWDGTDWVEGGVKPPDPPELEIARLKEELSATDYQIIKCYEYQLAGEPLPYDINTLHAERQTYRDRINALEQQL